MLSLSVEIRVYVFPPLLSDRGRREHGSTGSHFAPNIVMLTSCGVRQGEAGLCQDPGGGDGVGVIHSPLAAEWISCVLLRS